MCSWKLGHRAVRFIINAASGLINYGCSHNLVYKGEAHCSPWSSCEGLYSPGCITTQAILTFTAAKLTQSHLIIIKKKKGVNLIRECIDGRGRACHGRRHTHPKPSWMNIHVCISYASLQQTAGKHLARMPVKQTNTSSPTAVLDSAWFSLLTLNHQPCSLNITICLIGPSKFPLPHPLPPSLHYFCSTTLLLPHCVHRPEDTDPHGRLWWFLPSLWGTPPYLNDLVS